MENPQAFPCLDSSGFGHCMRDPGMTLRDWFAGRALSAIITATSNGQHFPARDGRSVIEGMAFDAYELADLMLAYRAEDTPNDQDH